MNVFLWILQIVLALHTAMGAFWKFGHSAEATMPSLKAIPNGVWTAMVAIELLVALAFLSPALSERFKLLAATAAVVVAVEMLAFVAVHFASGDRSFGPPAYWLVVAALCTVVAVGRLS